MTVPLHLILAAAGSSRRFGGGDKLLADLNGAPVFVHALRRLLPAVTGKCVIAVPPGRLREFQEAAFPFTRDLELFWCEGGNCRSESVRKGIAALGEARGIVAVHDAARPLADAALLRRLHDAALEHGASLPGKAVSDTLWRGDAEGLLDARVEREGLFAVETPQLFDIGLWHQAAEKLPGKEFTDDAGLLRAAGFPVALVLNPEPNFKLTIRSDLEVLRALI
ncbi:MAG: 2-C-methyl-D-erythritol 4-phosphate cytidylyltransferase [Lentisphaeria bacterium]|nr:2-C-methyl-D-erythritol 4-phosphate cytidylyltransferase [Lentisphaeria bacterium]